MDMRGRHSPANKTSEDSLVFVKEHTDSFPQYESHYSRDDNPHRKYLSPDLSISKMYILCTKQEKLPVSEWIYRILSTKASI